MLYCSTDDILRDGFRLDGREELKLDDIIEAASRIVDDACEVAHGYFAKARDQVTLRVIAGQGTRQINPGPYRPGSLNFVGYADGELAPDYYEQDGWLVADGCVWREGSGIEVEAAWGWPETPADIRKATVQTAIMLLREDDPAYGRAVTDANGGASIVRGRAIPPTVQLICDKWRARQAPAIRL